MLTLTAAISEVCLSHRNMNIIKIDIRNIMGTQIIFMKITPIMSLLQVVWWEAIYQRWIRVKHLCQRSGLSSRELFNLWDLFDFRTYFCTDVIDVLTKFKTEQQIQEQKLWIPPNYNGAITVRIHLVLIFITLIFLEVIELNRSEI